MGRARYNVHQIYFDEESKGNLDTNLTPYYNQKLHYTFENKVILDLLDKGEHRKAEYFGVLSHDYKAESRITTMTWDKFWSTQPEDLDVISFFSFSKTKNIFISSDQWHPGFLDTFKYMIKVIGYDFRWHAPLFNVLRNNWIAREHVWQDYYVNFLKPAMKAMDSDPVLKAKAWEDARYQRAREPRIRKQLENHLGTSYYPMAPFLLERLPVFFLSQRNFKQQHII